MFLFLVLLSPPWSFLSVHRHVHPVRYVAHCCPLCLPVFLCILGFSLHFLFLCWTCRPSPRSFLSDRCSLCYGIPRCSLRSPVCIHSINHWEDAGSHSSLCRGIKSVSAPACLCRWGVPSHGLVRRFLPFPCCVVWSVVLHFIILSDLQRSAEEAKRAPAVGAKYGVACIVALLHHYSASWAFGVWLP